MKGITFLIILVALVGFYTITTDLDSVEAVKTGSYNFCSVQPAFPECGGWRSETITDNFWFCDYVYLKEFCRNTPDPEKQIPLRVEDQCCKYIGPELKKMSTAHIDQNSQSEEISNIKEKTNSILPLIIWTDKDHYNFRDKVTVYGKFDFTNPSIIKNIKGKNFAQTGEISEETFTVDIKLNGNIVLRNIPVTEEGWFSAFFYQNNIYKYSTQNNILEVEYIITQGVIPASGPRTHATYHFTTGDIVKEEKEFGIWIDDSFLPNKIHYGINVKNPEKFIEHTRHDLVISRLITPDGYTVPIDSYFSIQNISTEYSEFTEYGHGTYTIQITYGNNVSKTTFEY